MKIALLTIKIILIILLILNLFFWAALYGSGHKIPKATEVTMALWCGMLILALIVLSILKRRVVK